MSIATPSEVVFRVVELTESGFTPEMVAAFLCADGNFPPPRGTWNARKVKEVNKEWRRARGIAPKEYGVYDHGPFSGYSSWTGAKDRCFNPGNPDYSDYGGRGIGMDPKWAESFPQFSKDMGPRPSLQHSIDRINTNGNYEPGNCRWATPEEQATNRRTTRWLTYNGVTKSQEQWAETLGMSPGALCVRLRHMPVEEALRTPKFHSPQPERIMELRTQGHSFYAIGRTLGKTGEAVSITFRDYLYKMGLSDPLGTAIPRPRNGHN